MIKILRYLVPSAAVIVVAFSFVSSFLASSDPRGRPARGDISRDGTRSFDGDNGGADSNIRSRSKLRHPTPTLEETVELLRNTVIPLVDLPPDQSVDETVNALNELLQKNGIPPHQLKITYDKSHPSLGMLRFRDPLAVRNIPVGVALKYICGRTIVRYQVRRGVVELITHDTAFAESLSPTPVERSDDPVDPDDPFAEPGSPPVEEGDPFAPPSRK
jgi:hypothetical protein